MNDKLIHKDEFRLRILLTNECDKNCSFCLNDFQLKEPVVYANMFDVADCLRAYGSFMKGDSIVTFSGGEPGLHPGLEYMLRHARHYCKTVKVVTNGLAFCPDLVPFVDTWHIGVTGINREVLGFLQYTKNITVQLVVIDNMRVQYLLDFVSFYKRVGILVKLFIDFNSSRKDELESRIENVQNMIGDGVCTRFTGKQINRGVACLGCERDCVTLKALWYFPDGRSSTCPQGVTEYFDDDDSWDETVEQAYNAHLYIPEEEDE